MFPAAIFLTEKSLIIGTSSSLGWSSFLGWLLIGAAGVIVLAMIVILACLGVRGNRFNVKYEDISW